MDAEFESFITAAAATFEELLEDERERDGGDPVSLPRHYALTVEAALSRVPAPTRIVEILCRDPSLLEAPVNVDGETTPARVFGDVWVSLVSDRLRDRAFARHAAQFDGGRSGAFVHALESALDVLARADGRGGLRGEAMEMFRTAVGTGTPDPDTLMAVGRVTLDAMRRWLPSAEGAEEREALGEFMLRAAERPRDFEAGHDGPRAF